MEKRTFEEKVLILQRNLQKRLENLPKFTEQMQEQLKNFEGQRTQLVTKIKKYEDDEFVVKILKSNLDFIDSQYEKEIAEHKSELDRLQRSKPLLSYMVKELNEVIKYPTTYTILEAFLDLFLERTISDWVLLEEEEKESSQVS